MTEEERVEAVAEAVHGAMYPPSLEWRKATQLTRNVCHRVARAAIQAMPGRVAVVGSAEAGVFVEPEKQP